MAKDLHLNLLIGFKNIDRTMEKVQLTLPNIYTCIVLDVIGMASYVIPALGEFIDVGWAFISAIIFRTLFGGRVGMIGSVLNFLEEAIPFTDIIPSFTIAWFIRKREIEKMLNSKDERLL